MDEGTLEAEHVDDTVTVSFDGDVSQAASLKGVLELRSKRPLAEFDDPFAWTVRSEATRRTL